MTPDRTDMPQPAPHDDAAQTLHRDHARTWQHNKYVYPVLSRRSRGLSLGINLNPDKVCNFDCIYCQVNRREEAETKFVELDRLLEEVDRTLETIVSGRIYEDEKFSQVPEPLRRLNDIAFSGDGEPTTFRNFDDIVARVAALKEKHGLADTKLVLITNASMFHRPAVERGLEILDAHNGEIWAKLDAGTEEYYQRVERTRIPFQQILDNLHRAAQKRPLVIQSLFLKIAGEPPGDAEIDAFCDRLNEVLADGGAISLVQVYTVARPPAESYVTPLADDELAAIGRRVETRTGLPVACFPSR